MSNTEFILTYVTPMTEDTEDRHWRNQGLLFYWGPNAWHCSKREVPAFGQDRSVWRGEPRPSGGVRLSLRSLDGDERQGPSDQRDAFPLRGVWVGAVEADLGAFDHRVHLFV